MAPRRRLDAELVHRSLAPSRSRAAELIESGAVLVAGAPADKPARLVAPGDPIVVVGDAPRYVSRAGAKLAAALEQFALDVAGARCLDVGASTGGFTDCLLQAGAHAVVALDVGYGQLHEHVRADDRVTVVERRNIRDVEPGELGPPFDVIVVDVSFISLRIVATTLLQQAAPGATLVALVKPQFEAGRKEAERGSGVIRDHAIWDRVLREVIAAFTGAGATIMGCMPAAVRGASGNVEFLLALMAPGGERADGSSIDPATPDPSAPEVDALVRAAIEHVGSA